MGLRINKKTQKFSDPSGTAIEEIVFELEEYSDERSSGSDKQTRIVIGRLQKKHLVSSSIEAVSQVILFWGASLFRIYLSTEWQKIRQQLAASLAEEVPYPSRQAIQEFVDASPNNRPSQWRNAVAERLNNVSDELF